MKSFKSYISEEVLPTARVENGNFDLENEAVRSEVNSILAGICSVSCVTPYVTLRKVSKALAYFSVILPKRTFLEGDKGVEVYEIRQFGDRIGMTDQGEFVTEVPVKYHLFFQYVQVMGRFIVTAKVVDQAELDRLLDTAEMTMKECWDKATMSQRKAIKEPIQTNGNHGSPSTKKAMDTSDEKSADVEKTWPAVVKEEEQIDEVGDTRRGRKVLGDYIKRAHVSGLEAASKGEIAYARKDKAGLHKANKTGEKREQGINRAADRLSMEEEYEKVEAGVKKRPGETHTLHRRNPGHKTEYHTITTDRDGRKSVKTGSPKYIKKHWDKLEEEHIDEVSKGAAISAYREKYAQERPTSKLRGLIRRKFGAETLKHAERAGASDTGHLVRKGESHGTDRLARAKPSSEMRKTKSGKIHKQDVASKKDEIKFRKSMSKFDKKRGHLPEETLDEGMAPVKKSYGMRKMKKKVSTAVKQGLGVEKGKDKTILVTNKGDPKAAGGGGVHRIPRDKYDPSKHNMASE